MPRQSNTFAYVLILIGTIVFFAIVGIFILPDALAREKATIPEEISTKVEENSKVIIFKDQADTPDEIIKVWVEEYLDHEEIGSWTYRPLESEQTILYNFYKVDAFGSTEVFEIRKLIIPDRSGEDFDTLGDATLI